MGIFHFPRTGKWVENVWKPLVVQRSRVGQRKEMPCFLAFFSCLRWENALLSAILPNAVIPTHFQVVAVRLSCKKWYLFLYLSVFYTINHLDIYRYVYYTYMFWWSPYFFDEKKPKKKQEHFRLENIDCTKYQLIVVIADEILSKTFFSSWK